MFFGDGSARLAHSLTMSMFVRAKYYYACAANTASGVLEMSSPAPYIFSKEMPENLDLEEKNFDEYGF